MSTSDVAAETAKRGTPSHRPDMTLEEVRTQLALAERRHRAATANLRRIARELADAEHRCQTSELSVSAWRGQVECAERLLERSQS